MTTPIEYIETIEGDNYPVGKSYIDPIVTNKVVDYPYTYNTSGTGSIALSIEGTPVASVTLYPIDITSFSVDEIGASHLKLSHTESNVDIVEEYDYPLTTNIDGLLTWFCEQQSITLDAPFDAFEQQPCGLFGTETAGIVIVSANAAVSTSDVTTTGSGSISLTATVTIPAAGTYWSTTAVDPSVFSTYTNNLTVGNFEFDRRFVGFKSVTITNLMIADQYFSNNMAVPLIAFPSLNKDLTIAARNGYPIILHSVSSGDKAVIMSIAYYNNVWTFYDGSTLTLGGTSENPTLTYTSAS